MWERKSAEFVRAMAQLPNSIGKAGLKSFAGLSRYGSAPERLPGLPGHLPGHVVPITGPGVGRVGLKVRTSTLAEPARIVAAHPRRLRRLPGIAVAFAGLLIVALAISIVDWMVDAARTLSIGGLALSAIFMLALLAASAWLWRELRSWQSLAVIEELQSDLSRICETAADELLFHAALAKLRASAREPQLARFVAGADLTADVAALRQSLDRIGLQGMDANAADAIRAGSRDVFFLSLVSTNPLIEAAIFTVRALGLIRRVASAYGCRPGRFGLIRLARHIFTDIALLPVGMLVALEAGREAGSAIRHVAHGAQAAARVAHPLAGVAVGALGHAVGAVAEGVTPRVAEATLAAGRMAHFGLLAAAIVRPVAFSDAGYRDLRNGIYKQIVGLRRDAVISRKRDSAALASDAAATM